MEKSCLSLLLILGITINSFGQNLVPNHSFEQESSCMLTSAGWTMPEIDYAQFWDMPTIGTSDHYHPCHTGGFGQYTPPDTWSGFKYPQNGNSYAGLMTHEFGTGIDYKEYMQVQLTSPLTAGETYEIGFYYSLSNFSQYATNGLGMQVNSGATFVGTQGPLPGPASLEVPLVQTDTVGWHLLQGSYIAVGGEDYIIIGCFTPDASLNIQTTGFGSAARAYYYIDSVFVELYCDPTITSSLGYCDNASAVDLTAVMEGTWSGVGITDPVTGTFDPQVAGPGTHQIVNTLTGNCNIADTVQITVGPPDIVSLSYPQAIYCEGDPPAYPSVNSPSNGTYSISAGGVMNTTTGGINLALSGAGTYTISYQTDSICPNSTQTIIDIQALTDPTISPQGDTMCEAVNMPILNLTSASSGGTWSGNGVDPITGEFDPNLAGPGTHQISYTSIGACPATDMIDIVIDSLMDPSFTLSTTDFCENGLSTLPVVTGDPGGTFVLIDPLDIFLFPYVNFLPGVDPVSGELDLNIVPPGTYLFTYWHPSVMCNNAQLTQIVVQPLADATIDLAGPYCENDNAVNMTAATTLGTWSGTGITDPVTGEFTPASAGVGIHQVIYTTGGVCPDADTISIVVNAVDDPTFSYSSSSFCQSELNPTPDNITSPGGVFSISGGGAINATTGEIVLAFSGIGTFDVTYSTSGPCPDSSVMTITIEVAGNPTIDPSGPFCENALMVDLNAASAGGVWSGPGIVDNNSGSFDPSVAGNGTHQIIYSFGVTCNSADTVQIVVNPSSDATFQYPNNQQEFYEGQPSFEAQILGVSGGVFTINNGGVIDPITGQIDTDLTGEGSYLVTYTSPAPCSETYQLSILIVESGELQVVIPNVFTPDNDQINDLFEIEIHYYQNYEAVILNRWGNVVHTWNENNAGWDGTSNGKEASEGTYFYKVTVTDLFGVEHVLNGFVQLVR